MKDWMRAKINKPWVKIKSLQPVADLPLPRNAKKSKKRKRKERLRRERQEATHRCLAYLKDFWPRFDAADCDLKRLELLRRAAHIPGWPRVSKDLRRMLRNEFRREAHKLLNIPVEKCGTCDNRPQEKHHIIPLMFGGINANNNLILICLSCHDFIHPWMKPD